MFLEDLPKACEIEVLVILKQNQAEIEFTESQLQFLDLANRISGSTVCGQLILPFNIVTVMCFIILGQESND
jgi:hypothetical protein